MSTPIATLEAEVLAHLATLTTEPSLIEYRNAVLGKSGSLTALLRDVKSLSDEEKRSYGKAVNEARDRISAAFDGQRTRIDDMIIAARLSEWEDMTAPIPRPDAPHIHPLTRVLTLVEDSFKRMGFEIAESPEVTTEYANFDALNIPATHPARDMQDTFWLEGRGNVLATQTSCMQNVIYRSKTPPIRVVIPGRTFRNEAVDATHENTFYQLEGIVVDRGIHLGHLKYTVRTALSDIFGKEVSVRLRPGFFPFVEPGVEVDFSCTFCEQRGCRICKGS